MPYTDKNILEIEFSAFPASSYNYTGTISNDEDSEFITDLYLNHIKHIKFNKKRNKKDFWTRKSIVYPMPRRYQLITIRLDNEEVYNYYIFNGMLFEDPRGYVYSTTGIYIGSEISYYIQEKSSQ